MFLHPVLLCSVLGITYILYMLADTGCGFGELPCISPTGKL